MNCDLQISRNTGTPINSKDRQLMLANLLHKTEEYCTDRILSNLIACPVFYFLGDLQHSKCTGGVYLPAR